jgi:hypothetical protein
MTVSLHKRMRAGSISGRHIRGRTRFHRSRNRIRLSQGRKFQRRCSIHWKISGIMTYGSGRRTNTTVSGDPNQDGKTSNDRLSKVWTQCTARPDYASMDRREAWKMNLRGRYRLD